MILLDFNGVLKSKAASPFFFLFFLFFNQKPFGTEIVKSLDVLYWQTTDVELQTTGTLLKYTQAISAL